MCAGKRINNTKFHHQLFFYYLSGEKFRGPYYNGVSGEKNQILIYNGPEVMENLKI